MAKQIGTFEILFKLEDYDYVLHFYLEKPNDLIYIATHSKMEFQVQLVHDDVTPLTTFNAVIKHQSSEYSDTTKVKISTLGIHYFKLVLSIIESNTISYPAKFERGNFLIDLSLTPAHFAEVSVDCINQHK
jgi:hypothetical protein